MYSAQSAAALAIANAAAALGSYTFNWALNNYATTSAMTTQAVSNYLQMSGYGLGLAKNQLNQYESTYVPEMQQLAQLAGTYTSPARTAVNMGAAEAQSTQGTQAGIDAATKNLQSYGIDPSSGMYGELQEAARTAGGAAAAGAGQQAELSTQATGRQLLGESIQVGEQLPGSTVNALNSAYQGVAGAENSTLANVASGANSINSANNLLGTAMNLKYPPVGNVQQSTGIQSSLSTGNPANQGGGGGSGSSGAAPYNPPQPTPSNPNMYNAGAGGGNPSNPYSGSTNYGTGAGSGGLGQAVSVPGSGGGYAPSTPGAIPSGGNYGEVFTGSGFEQGGAIPDFAEGGYASPTALPSGGGDTNNTTYSPAPTAAARGGSIPDFAGGGFAPGAGSSGGFAPGSGGAGLTAPRADPMRGGIPRRGGVPDISRPVSGGIFMAAGGDPTTGGHVPTGASPSAGRQTDDIPARLNANEFVIPRDVAEWKGQEFFQKLIDQSRKARTGASAQPTMGKPPAVPQRPRFVSQHMGGGTANGGI